jgi:hypothetical protein
MDRFKAIAWLQEQLIDHKDCNALVDALNQTWQTLDALQEHLLPESVLTLLLARPTHERGATSEEPTFTLQNISLSEFFALSAACAHYDTELRLRDRRDLRLDALEQLHQRILSMTVQPPCKEEE